MYLLYISFFLQAINFFLNILLLLNLYNYSGIKTTHYKPRRFNKPYRDYKDIEGSIEPISFEQSAKNASDALAKLALNGYTSIEESAAALHSVFNNNEKSE